MSIAIFRRFIWNFLRLENEHLNNCGQFRAVRDISIHPINIPDAEVAEEDGRGLRGLKRRASEILGINNQSSSVTAARRRSSIETGRRLSIPGNARRPSLQDQDLPALLENDVKLAPPTTSRAPPINVSLPAGGRRRRYTVAGLLGEASELRSLSVIKGKSVSENNTQTMTNGERMSDGEGGNMNHRIDFVIPETAL